MSSGKPTAGAALAVSRPLALRGVLVPWMCSGRPTADMMLRCRPMVDLTYNCVYVRYELFSQKTNLGTIGLLVPSGCQAQRSLCQFEHREVAGLQTQAERPRAHPRHAFVRRERHVQLVCQKGASSNHMHNVIEEHAVADADFRPMPDHASREGCCCDAQSSGQVGETPCVEQTVLQVSWICDCRKLSCERSHEHSPFELGSVFISWAALFNC